ncbi:hypothetical protein CIPAW_09G050100 [Carya illinoinensis]|uniref:Uncharacterized protein n=1 Tax=Carya illinoinensis TaxID=32201 RepID=A0A8T1PHM0_CARIL|nr:hypothetical protein CIPAW_09G050100 [Carya illinoinensis]
MEEETMELSESQILQPLGSRTTPATLPMIADLPMRAGNLVEACSRKQKRSSSLVPRSIEGVDEGVEGDAEQSSAFDSLDCALECFFVLGGIFSRCSLQIGVVFEEVEQRNATQEIERVSERTRQRVFSSEIKPTFRV